jgi:glycosyltransferase involved in cell wall biosynthesis
MPGELATGSLVEIVVPVHNEARTLESAITRLRHYLDRFFPFSTLITVADNASTDGTDALARSLAVRLAGVQAVHFEEKGRGGALRSTWLASRAQVVAYMDADLATGLEALLPLVAPLLSGHSDIAIGSRLAGGSHVVRGPKRELISRCYNALVHHVLRSRFSDAQCGFKALRADTARSLLPLVEDNGWFFDTELLVLAERNGLRIHEVPVDWVDDPDSRVAIVRTALDDLRGIWRLLRMPSRLLEGGAAANAWPRPGAASFVARFAGIGVLSTGAYVALFLAFGHWLGRYGANALALTLCTVANTWVHARLASSSATRPSGRRTLGGGVGLLLAILVLTSAGLALTDVVDPGSRIAEVVALVIATFAAALLRFVVVHAWSFRHQRQVAANRFAAPEESAA